MRKVLVGTLLLVAGMASAQAPLLFDLDFSSGTMAGWRPVSVNPMPVITTEQARTGKYSAKSFLDSSDPDPERRERVEMAADRSANAAELGKEYWYGWSIYLPDPYPIDPKHWEILTQFHQTEEHGRNPALDFGFSPGTNHWGVNNRADPREITVDKTGIIYHSWDLGASETGKWTDFAINVKWSWKSDGFLRIYRNGKKVVDYAGPNCYNDSQGPQFKMGIYKAGWAHYDADPAVKTRLAYHGAFKMAGADGSLAAVSPAQSVRPNPPSAISIQ